LEIFALFYLSGQSGGTELFTLTGFDRFKPAFVQAETRGEEEAFKEV